MNALVATFLLAIAQDAVPPAPAGATEPAAPVDAVFGYTRYKEEVERLSRDFPGYVRVERLGESRQGRELSLLVVSDARGRDAAQKPALLVTADLFAPDGGARAARALIETARQLAMRADTEPRIAELFAERTLYFVPALDPDRAFGEQRPVAAARGEPPRLAVDFPIDWRPQGDRFAPYPLSEPESRAVVALLRARANLSAVLVYANSLRGASAGSAPAEPQPYVATPASSGTLEAFCEGRLGQRVYTCTPWRTSGEDEPVLEIAAAQRAVEILAADLPRLVCDPPSVERLRANLWLVDASIHNTGRLSTGFDSPLARRSGLDVRLRTSGAKVVGIAQQKSGGTFESLAPAGDACRLGHLAGGDGITVRLVVEAQENSSLELSFESPRAGETRVLVPLL